MPKPTTAPPPKPYDGPPCKRIRAIQVESNNYTLVEETFGPPIAVKVLKTNCPRISAEDRVRIYGEEKLGINRFSDSGL